MSLIGILSCSGIGMMSQAHALEQIGSDIANVNTTAYKATTTLFQTEAYHYGSADSKYFTATPVDVRSVTQAGLIKSTGADNDLAIQGNGFFLIQQKLDNSGELFLSRDGAFGTTNLDPDGKTFDSNKAFLVNGNSDYVLGWQYDAATRTYASNISPLDITPYKQIDGLETSKVTFDINIPASGTNSELIGFNVYDSAFNTHNASLSLVRSEEAINTWKLSVIAGEGTVATPPIDIVFNGDGELISPLPATQTIDVTWDDGTPSSFTVDFSKITQLGASYVINNIDNNGLPIGNLKTIGWDEQGVLYADYSNGLVMPVAKLAIGSVTSPNQLNAISNNLFATTQNSGEIVINDLTSGAKGMYTSLVTKSLESSNVSLETEFSNLITTQQAYSSNATVFSTGNEMYQTAINILS